MYVLEDSKSYFYCDIFETIYHFEHLSHFFPVPWLKISRKFERSSGPALRTGDG